VKYHKDRVSKLVYNQELDVLISASHDYSLTVYDMRKEAVVASVKTGKAWLSSVTVDADRGVIYAGTFSGLILAYSFQNNQLSHVHTLTGHEEQINTIQFHKDGHIITGSDDTTFPYMETKR